MADPMRVQFLGSLDGYVGRLFPPAAFFYPWARQVIIEFWRAGATTSDCARTFHPASALELLAFSELLRIAVIREARPGRYFLDERVLRRRGVSVSTE